MSFTINVENSSGQRLLSKVVVVPTSSKFEVLIDARGIILDQIEEISNHHFHFVYKKIKLTKFQEQKQIVQRILEDNALTISLPPAISLVTITLSNGDGDPKVFGTVLCDTECTISKLRQLIESKFKLAEFIFLKKGIPLREFQERIYNISQILDDETVSLRSNTYQAQSKRSDSFICEKRKQVIEVICISDEEKSHPRKDEEFKSKIEQYTIAQIVESSGFEKDRKIFFNNFITHNKEFLLTKEMSKNSTTVYGIVDTAWCKVKTKLLLNEYGKYQNELHHVKKWIDKMNLTNFAIDNDYKKVRKCRKQENRETLVSLEKELNENLSKLKTYQANIEKALETDKKRKERKKDIPAERCSLMEQKEIDFLVTEIKMDYNVFDS